MNTAGIFTKLFQFRTNLQPCKIQLCANYSNLPSLQNNDTVVGEVEALKCDVKKDLSEVTSYFPVSFNLAAYVNSSELLQNFIHLNVNLSKIERKPHIAQKILKLDLEKDVKPHIMFLKDYVEDLGAFITKNPLILCEPLNNLEVRVNYLKFKQFINDDIKSIIERNPFWLSFSTQRIDRRLGYFQEKFLLPGKDVRYLAAKQPKIITYSLHHINTNTFVVKEEMGFNDKEIQGLLLSKPKLWMINQKSLIHRFNYLHHVIKIPHATLLEFPGVLTCRSFRLQQRHSFLKKLGRAQYNPKEENYVPLIALAEKTDVEFCNKYAKCTVSDFNLFLKTL